MLCESPPRLPGRLQIHQRSLARSSCTESTMPETSSTAASPAPGKRACDACHRRKVKCIGDGTRPCKNCTSAGLTCTYNAIPQKKGPKGSRAKVISELRETQRQTQLAAHHHGYVLRSPSIDLCAVTDKWTLTFMLVADVEFSQRPLDVRQHGLLSMDMITSCVTYYFENLYATQPILHRQRVGETIGIMDTNIEAYCLVVSLCAYMMIQPNMTLPPGAFDGLEVPPQSSLQLGHTLLQEALRVRKQSSYIEDPSIWSVITSFFFFGSFFCLDKHNTAWFHLREATTLAQILGMHEESHYTQLDVIETSRQRRLYWLLFVTERAYALQQHRPLTLHSTINLPTLDEDPAETIELNGFLHLVNLYRPFDDTFVGTWNKARSGCTTEWVAQLQQQLSEALPEYLHSTESQAVDLRTSQQWLRTMVWQLSINHGFLSSTAAENAMSFKFPIEVSRDLVAFASQFSQQAMEVHGIGLIEKLFDVACTLTDVMSCVPFEHHTFEFGPRDYLNQLMSLIGTLRGGQQRYLPLLLAKIDAMPPTTMGSPGYVLPAVPALSRLEEIYDEHNSAPTSGESSPFGSPPLSAIGEPAYPFQDLGLGHAPRSSAFTPASVTDSQFANVTSSAPLQMYQAPSLMGFSGTSMPMKYEAGD
nr:putative sucrose utilization protein suc1 [Quercus suber]